MNLEAKQYCMVWMGHFIRDFRFAFRMLRKNLCFTGLAVLTLGLGIGAVSAMFGVFDALVLNPFPYPDPDRIAYIWSNNDSPLSAPDFRDIRKQSKCFAEIGAYNRRQYNLGLKSPLMAVGVECTASVLRILGMKPMLGRLLNENDEEPGAAPVAVISHSLWRRVLGADTKAPGRTIRVNGLETTVVGIMPPDFEFPSPFYDGRNRFEIWIPLSFDDANSWFNRENPFLLCIGRVKDDVTMAAMEAEVKMIGIRLSKEYPDTNLERPFLVRSFKQETTSVTAPATRLLLGAGALLLLTACANVASLLLARGAQRQSELGIRLASGASRRDIFRLLFTESLILALLGGIVGILFARWGLIILKHVIPLALIIEERREALQLNGLVLAFTVGLSVFTTAIFGLPTAVAGTRKQVREILQGDGWSQTGSRLRHRFLHYLVAGQIALAMVLANGAILLSTSYLKVLKENQILDTDQVLTAELAFHGDRYKEAETRQNIWRELLDDIKAFPGVVDAAFSNKVPLEGGGSSPVLVDNEVSIPGGAKRWAGVSFVSSEYFKAIGLSVLRGRVASPEDAGKEIQGVAVNQALADACWPGQNPIGRRIQVDSTDPWFKAIVVGVVSDVRQYRGAEQPASPEIYFSLAAYNYSSITLVVKTTGDAHIQISPLRHLVARLDRDLPLANVQTMKEALGRGSATRRILVQLVGLFMAVTVILAMVGVYGTLSYTLLQRRREIGVRMALGAMRRDILSFVFRQVAPIIVGGLVVGLMLTVGLSFVLRSALYSVNPLDPLLFLIGLSCIGTASAGACFLPACRAMRVHPMEALRCE